VLLTIHRGARQVGGNCIELESGGARVLLDIGAPLDLAEGEQATLPKTLRLGRDDGQLLGVIVSHAHQDHYGLWNHVPASVPCYIGKQSLDVMRAARPFLRNAFIPANALTYDTGQPFQLGPFRVTPYLVDHSAFNAHALLVEADGKRSLYTGDLRAHGWKRGVLHRLLKSCPRPLDALVMEGTSVGRVEPGKKPKTEAALVGELVTSMKETPGLVLALFASQNIDRFVTFQKAANSAGRTMVVDAYTAEIIRASGLESLPDPTKSDLLVFLPYRMKQKILREGNAHTMDKYKGRRIFLTGRDTVKDRAGKLVIVFRDSMRGELSEHGCLDGARLIYSMWSGYLQKHLKPLPKWCSDHGVEFEARHTSGHADLATLKRIVRALVPTRLIPIHTSDTDAFAREFPGARLLPDGVPLAL
jgi:ribonuclease J